MNTLKSYFELKILVELVHGFWCRIELNYKIKVAITWIPIPSRSLAEQAQTFDRICLAERFDFGSLST